jgi:hypothetical protein
VSLLVQDEEAMLESLVLFQSCHFKAVLQQLASEAVILQSIVEHFVEHSRLILPSYE